MTFSPRTGLLALIVLSAAVAAGGADAALLPSESATTAAALRDRVAAGSRAPEWVREITERAGPRLAGSPGDRAAVAVTLEMLRRLGFASVRAEKVMVPVWVRTAESGEVTAPVSQKLALAALGGSVPTSPGGLEAEVLRITSFDQLEAKKSAVRGRIVFYDVPTERTRDGSGYTKSVVYRSEGASHAAKLGALGVLVRSIGTDTNRLPHTGAVDYAGGAPTIPAAAVSIPDADLLAHLASLGGPVRVHFTLACGALPYAESANVVAEVPGREKPGEIVLLGAHLDSWDLGRGAIDDGAGCGIVIEAARQIAALPQKPRRTVRVVLYANEENGLAGGTTYVETHKTELARHVAALEADQGTGRPLGLSWRAGASAAPLFDQIAALLGPLDAGALTVGGEGGADISRLLTAGVPLVGLAQDASAYFDFHHTANDTFDKIVPRDLDRAAAAMAVAAWCLAETPEPIERVPADQRKLPW
ncbi:MAG TPA: M20/M25/M40 family metallo-hydrolase [Thermoanaerobaculia bacterium]|nr:M20/M25/M40 family metallo-hydrolase [Thermoanaerobaculia bacterium]